MDKISDRTLISQTPEKIGQKVNLFAQVQTVRDHGKITFIDLSDRSGLIQCVGEKILKLSPCDVVAVEGLVKKRPEKLVNTKIKTGNIEIEIDKITLLAKSEELPFDLGQEVLAVELPTLLDWRSLTLKHPKIKQIFKIQAAVMAGFRKAVTDLDCTEIFVPTISASSTEGGAEVFKVNYFGHPAFLTQSPQLYKQMLVPVFELVFTVSHIYRAEPSVTTRHLTESTQLDCEFGFVDFEQLLDLLEKVGRDTLNYVSNNCSDILSDFGVKPPHIGGEIPRIKMRDAQKIVLDKTGVDHTKEKDLTPEDEREICLWAKEKYDSDLVTITHFPTAKRAFYTLPDPENPDYSLSFDLLFGGMEILSGSQRISDYRQLKDTIKKRGMNPADFEMYLQAFRFGMPPEGGFSFGLERLTMQILKLKNIREASLFPRDMERVDFGLA